MTFREKFFGLDGRIGRADWWIGQLLQWGLILVPMIVAALIQVLVFGVRSGEENPPLAVTLTSTIVMLPAWIASAAVGICTSVQRFHDRNQSGWWLLISFLPLLGPIYLLINLGFIAGTPGPNKYGPGTGMRGGEAAVSSQAAVFS